MQGPFQIFVKPAGALCNLACDYCYYLQKKDLYAQPGNPWMDETTLGRYISQHIEACTEDTVMFSWHGGEPLLAGIDFYERAVWIQKQFSTGKRILNGIQTNGTLIDDAWCRFFAREHFIVGISIDGPEKLHNIYRKSKNGEGSFSRAVNGYRLLRKYGITAEILCVVNSHNVNHPAAVYSLFRKLGAEYITFLPLVEKTHEGVSERTVPAAAFGRFLSGIFDMWVQEDIGRIKIQIFEEAARAAFNQDHTLCIFRKECGGVPVLEHNGDVYSCDHYVDRKYLLGNISRGTLSGMLGCRKQASFGKAKSETLPRYCVYCEVRQMCNGECPKNRFIQTPDGEQGLNYLCEGYKIFFGHCRPFVEAIAEVWKKS